MITAGGLPRSHRLLTPAGYAAVFQHGCATRDAYFKVLAKPNGLPYARLGLAVSKRTSPKAVVRNRLKRHTREAFRLDQTALAGLDIVVVTQGAASTGAAPALRGSLTQHWQKILTKCKRP